ncbi:MAG: flavin reductase family protein [Nocardioidaceae bacterium]
MTAPAPDLFRAAMGRFASGVTVVSTVQDGVDHAMTASAFTSVSLDPPLVLVCVDKTTRFHQAVALSRRWGVSILAGSQLPVARWLAVRGRRLDGQLDAFPHRRGEHTGAALLEHALCHLECRTWEMYDGGDHTIVVGQVVALEMGPDDQTPMLFYRSDFDALGDD